MSSRARSSPWAPGVVVVGRFALERPIGRGGMGQVWLARELATGQRVALKFLHRLYAESELRRRFVREARASVEVDHSSIVPTRELFETEDGVPGLLMDWLEGEDLRARLDRDAKVGIDECARILVPVFDAVATAHSRGVVHRDLKPENVFLERIDDGATRARVLDFGVAKILGSVPSGSELVTRAGDVLGTPLYSSPEQLVSAPTVGAPADVWSLGVILYEMLAGARPFEGASDAEVIDRVLRDAVVPLRAIVPSVPREVSDLTRRMLQRAPERRVTLVEAHDILSKSVSMT